MNRPSTDVALLAWEYKALISQIASATNDTQENQSDKHVFNFHGLTSFASDLTSPYHFQIA